MKNLELQIRMKNVRALCSTLHPSLATLNSAGQSLIELMIAIGLTTILIPAVLTGMVSSSEGKAQQGQRLGATVLLNEAQEAVRTVREAGWSSLPANGTYHPIVSGLTWALAANTDTVNGYTRQIVIEDVFRDAAGAIATSGTLDPSTKKITTTIAWQTPTANSVSATNYISRYINNAALMQTTQAQFDTGVKSVVESTNTAGGEVQLPSWGIPAVSATVDIAGTEDAQKVVVSGSYAFVGSLARASIGEFIVINLTTNTVAANLEFSENVTAMALQGNYVYLITSNANTRLRIIDISNPTAPVAVGSPLSMGVTVNGGSIAVNGSYAYIGTLTNANQEFYVVNVANPSAPSIIGKREIGFNVTGIALNGNYAFLATSHTTGQLKIVDVSNPAAPGAPVSYNMGAGRGALSIDYDNNTIYLGLSSGTGADLYTINVANPLVPTALGSLDITGPVNGIFVVNGIAFVATTVSNKQATIVGVHTPASPTIASTVNLGGNATGVYFVDNKAYFSDANNTGELKIISGGGGVAYHDNGSFESSTMDTGNTAAFNNISFTATNSQASPLGNTHIGTSIDVNDSDFINSSRFTMGPTARTVASISVYVGAVDAAPNNQFETAIYTDNAGVPGTLVAKSQRGTLTANSWNTVTISASLAANTNYWLAYNTNGTSGSVNNMRYDPGGLDAWTTNGQTFGTWPNSFGPATTGTFKFSIYAAFDSAGSGAQLKLQVATNNDDTTWNYVGPDGTSNTYFTASGPIPLNNISGRYIRYKMTLAGDGTITPILQDVTVNYSP